MRWTRNDPVRGDREIVRRFLLFPKRIGNEVRWLEFANILVEYKITGSFEGFRAYWDEIKFVD